VSTDGSTESNVRSFETFVTIYLSITVIINYTKYLIIKLSAIKIKSLKNRNNEIIFQHLRDNASKMVVQC
jgi:hypothetical protein